MKCCEVCGSTYLIENAHWIHTKKARPDLKNEPWNQMYQCQKCHREAHTIGFVTWYRKHKHRLSAWRRECFERELGHKLARYGKENE